MIVIHVTLDSSFHEYLASVLGHHLEPRIVTSPKSRPSSPHTTITSSMLGQPPTVPGAIARPIGMQGIDAYENPSDEDENGFDQSIKLLTAEVTEDLTNVILQERPSTLEIQGITLMDGKPLHILIPDNCRMTATVVPKLPFAPEGLGRHFPPESLVELLSSDDKSTDNISRPPLLQLKKVTGVKPLNIELSWR